MFQIQISRRRQKFTTRYTFEDKAIAEFFFGSLRCGRNERKKLIVTPVQG